MKHKTRVNKAVFTRCGVNPQAKSSSSAHVQDGGNKKSENFNDASLLRIACACEDRTIILYDLEGKQVAEHFSSLFSLLSSLFSLFFLHSSLFSFLLLLSPISVFSFFCSFFSFLFLLYSLLSTLFSFHSFLFLLFPLSSLFYLSLLRSLSSVHFFLFLLAALYSHPFSLTILSSQIYLFFSVPFFHYSYFES